MKILTSLSFAAMLALVLALPGAKATTQGGVVHVASLSTRPYARFIEPQHGAVHGSELSATHLDRIVVDVSEVFDLPEGSATFTAAAGQVVYHAEWKSGGMKVEVTVEPEEGEDHTSARNRFVKEVTALRETFPPEQAFSLRLVTAATRMAA